MISAVNRLQQLSGNRKHNVHRLLLARCHFSCFRIRMADWNLNEIFIPEK